MYKRFVILYKDLKLLEASLKFVLVKHMASLPWLGLRPHFSSFVSVYDIAAMLFN